MGKLDMQFLGLSKTMYNSGACLLKSEAGVLELEMALTERLNRQKASGLWPEQAIKHFLSSVGNDALIAENRDVTSARSYENSLDRVLPFFQNLESKNLERFTTKFNSSLHVVPHHLAHAMAAMALSPFEKALIVVMDGAGSSFEDAQSPKDVLNLGPKEAAAGDYEECSVYTLHQGTLKCVAKRWRSFAPSSKVPGKTFSEGIGLFYESAAEFVFNSNRAAGKLMGLAPLGKPQSVGSRIDFLENLNWEQAFKGKGKSSWENSPHKELYANIAATVQAAFEADYFDLFERLRQEFPEFDNLIFTGGCALNCTANAKLIQRKLFSQVYVPPFPGDECISLGAASYLYHSVAKLPWKLRDIQKQNSYFGPSTSDPSQADITEIFQGFTVRSLHATAKETAQLLSEGKILAWFQGRSECGPRALGNRSILANPQLPGLKQRLNDQIKFREDFRPYGCSCTHEHSHDLFEVDEGFNNPFMSFAVQTRADVVQKLHEVTHVDGTSRMQTVMKTQNPLFHELLAEFGKLTGLPCLLNTSLNVMGEPIIENALEARHFLSTTPVDGLVIGNFFISRKS